MEKELAEFRKESNWFHFATQGRRWNSTTNSYEDSQLTALKDTPTNEDIAHTGAIARGSIAADKYAYAGDEGGVAIGLASESHGKGTVAIGGAWQNVNSYANPARAFVDGSVAIGAGSLADGRSFLDKGKTPDQTMTDFNNYVEI